MALIVHGGVVKVDLKAVPNVGALADTSKDWIYSNGLLRPPPPPQALASSYLRMFANPAFSTATVFGWGSSSFGPYRPFAAPVALPVEKREMPVVGFRAWGCSQSFKLGWGRKTRLKSTGVAGEWSPGINTASCNGSTHTAPDENCACGFYVLTNLDEVENHVGINDGVVVGAVMGWGKVIQHGTEGWRTQYARILGLLDVKFSKQQDKVTRDVAEQYGLEIYGREALETYVKEWGDPLAA